MDEDEKAFHSGPWITTKPGLNRFVWDLRYEGSTRVLGNKLAAAANQGPLAIPGAYEVRLILTDPSGKSHTLAQRFEVSNDPRASVSREDLEAQLVALLGIRDHISRAHQAVSTIRSMKKQLAHWRERGDLSDDAHGAANILEDKLDEIEDKLMVPGKHKDTFGLNEPSRLSQKLASVISVIASADAKPTRNSLQVVAKYSTEIDQQLDMLDAVFDHELAAFNDLMAKADLPAVHR
jgi:hypothetical protein